MNYKRMDTDKGVTYISDELHNMNTMIMFSYN